MKLNRKYFTAVNVIIGLVGIICIYQGVVSHGNPFWDAIGTGLVAAAAVNILDRAVRLEPPSIPKPRIEVMSDKRIDTSEAMQSIHELKYKTSKVDLIGVSLIHVLEEFDEEPDRIINRLLRNNLQLRLLFVHPDSKYLEQRAREDKWDVADLVKRQKRAVDLSVKFYNNLRHAYDKAVSEKSLNTHKTGSLQIKLLDFCPYMTIYRVGEDEIYWGLYTSNMSGVNLPLFKTVLAQDPMLYKHLHQHIHGLIERDLKYPDLVSMSDMGEPLLNKELVKKILEQQIN